MFPGKDYYNPSRGGDFDGLENPFKDLVSRARVPRMPWHDVCSGERGKREFWRTKETRRRGEREAEKIVYLVNR